MPALFVFSLVVGVYVLCRLSAGDVVMAGGRFLGSGFVGGMGRTRAKPFCCGGVLVGKRVIV